MLAIRTGLCGMKVDIPVSQPSNSIDDKLETSNNLGNSKGFDSEVAKPISHVVPEATPASLSQGRNSDSYTPLG